MASSPGPQFLPWSPQPRPVGPQEWWPRTSVSPLVLAGSSRPSVPGFTPKEMVAMGGATSTLKAQVPGLNFPICIRELSSTSSLSKSGLRPPFPECPWRAEPPTPCSKCSGPGLSFPFSPRGPSPQPAYRRQPMAGAPPPWGGAEPSTRKKEPARRWAERPWRVWQA